MRNPLDFVKIEKKFAKLLQNGILKPLKLTRPVRLHCLRALSEKKNEPKLNTSNPSIIGERVTMQRFQDLLALVQSFEKDFEKFYVKNNKSAGTRLRKHMNELKKAAQEIRVEVQGMKKPEEKTPA